MKITEKEIEIYSWLNKLKKENKFNSMEMFSIQMGFIQAFHILDTLMKENQRIKKRMELIKKEI